MCLIAPSAKGLQKLLDVCLSQAEKLNLVYNKKKTVCMCVQPRTWKLRVLPKVYLGKQLVDYVQKYKYLGSVMFNDLPDDGDVQRQIRAMYSRANMLVRKFGKCNEEIKKQLFRTYLGNSYCSQLWTRVKSHQMNKLKVAYNNSLRIFFRLPKICSIREQFVKRGILSFDEFIRKDIYSFWQRLQSSSNGIISSLVGSYLKSKDLYTYDRWNKLLYVHVDGL